MLNLIAEYPLLFALFVCIITGVPTLLWWLHFNKQQATKAIAPGIKFTCICGKNFPSKMKFDSHQEDGTCPKQKVKPAVQTSTQTTAPKTQTTKPAPVTNVKKPSPLQKPAIKAQTPKNESIAKPEAKPKALRKSIKIKPRKKTAKKKSEDVISINEFAKSKAKINISKR